MAKKRHLNVFCVSANEPMPQFAEKVVARLAMYGIRAHGFSYEHINVKGADYNIKKGLIQGILSGIDVVAVFGNVEGTPFEEVLKLAKTMDKPVINMPEIDANTHIISLSDEFKQTCQFIINGGA